ncbi:Ferric reductase transmembrane component [Wickerhamomyces ciferrii]|uniref:ferric-chelate reductase (NADPH) n=1 Tax=Wickerhamomyces ciferrii (strain ATCC 14091 / BCRC 22168 / CBS 111 / JCM 3599 / NBRC 0793 / NRRL Y-1031 F-60-10) TaxID=1206466 RepID=K0K8Z2_WICCF|nr:Ferric reductase transmembrane component [Wickerhamomyces ciferrii]CCH41320.1 Ferric reductase transmembrane component [Wickerhamomyces ciferrii]
MNIKTYLLFLFAFLATGVQGESPAKTEKLGLKWKWMVFACDTALSQYTFGTNITKYYPLLCGYAPFTGSIVNCMANNLGDAAFDKAITRFQSTCANYGNHNYTVPELKELYENATEYAINLDQFTGNVSETVFYQPINITRDDVQNSLTYYEYLYFNYDEGSLLAGMMYVFFIIVFIVFGVANFITRLGFQRSFNNKFINWYRANVSIPALFNGKHTEAPTLWKIFSTLVPTRSESIVVFLFICLNILLATVHYSFRSKQEPTSLQIVEFMADRTGLLSFGLIPLLIIFAGRNNILSSLTGIPYTSMIVYHKWVARFMWIHAMLHSVGWTSYGVQNNALAYYYQDGYWRWGVFATVIGAAILFQAFHVFRNMAYETFVFIHIVFAVVFIVGCWYHCLSLGWLEWIYVSWAVWIFDRLLRVVRMCAFGFRNAEVELIADDTFKISVKHGRWFMPFPGSFGYVYFITPTMFWQSHPFTIVDSVTEADVTTCYIKTKGGITKRLNKQLSILPGNKKTIRISIEGPYGHRAPMEKYDTALLLAGGNGIPGPFYHAIDLSKRESSTKQQIKLNWVIRNPEALLWFADELKVLAHTNVETNIYITGHADLDKIEEKKEVASDDLDVKKETESDESKPATSDELISSLPHITFHHGRPNLEEIILQNFTDESGPSVAVMSCGPPKMVDTIRALTAKHLQKSKGRVDLFEELQVW